MRDCVEDPDCCNIVTTDKVGHPTKKVTLSCPAVANGKHSLGRHLAGGKDQVVVRLASSAFLAPQPPSWELFSSPSLGESKLVMLSRLVT